MRTWAIALFIILGISIFGCVQPVKPSDGISDLNTTVVIEAENITPAQITTGPCTNEQNVFASDECFLNNAKSSDDSESCNKIYTIKTRDECYLHFAPKDAKLCIRIASPTSRSDCYFDSARFLNDTDYCVKISDSKIKQKCLEELSPPCSFESNVQSKALCLALYHNASNFCQGGDDCLFELGIQRKNLAACNEIDESKRAQASACRAVVSDDVSKCNESGISVIADYCYEMAAYAADKYSWCTLTSSGSPYGLHCLMNFASKIDDPTLCKYADSELERDNCYMNYSITTGNYSTCDLIIVSLLDSQCRIATAMNHGDISACNKLMYKGRTNCYNLILSGKVPLKDEQSCQAINEFDYDPWQYRCLSQYAWQVKDSSICAKIEDKKYREECEFRFS